jgi:outer membrane protein assembly factor BamD
LTRSLCGRPRAASSLAALLCIVAAFSAAGCGSSVDLTNAGPEERFAEGKRLFDDGDYVEAITEFDIVKLQFPGSTVADDAQYYIGEAHYQKGEYLLAIEEFRTLKRNFASSPLIPAAQYHTGLAYYDLSPRSELDQTYSRQAIDEFQAFIEYYPADERRKDAEEKIRELNGKLARKLYDSAEQYIKLGYFRSAGVYYDLVIQQYHDSPFAEPAYIGKITSLVDRRRYAEAKDEIAKFVERYPESALRGEADVLQGKIPADNSGISR